MQPNTSCIVIFCLVSRWSHYKIMHMQSPTLCQPCATSASELPEFSCHLGSYSSCSMQRTQNVSNTLSQSCFRIKWNFSPKLCSKWYHTVVPLSMYTSGLMCLSLRGGIRDLTGEGPGLHPLLYNQKIHQTTANSQSYEWNEWKQICCLCSF